MRVNHTYGHGGALAYLAAYDVDADNSGGTVDPPSTSRRS